MLAHGARRGLSCTDFTIARGAILRCPSNAPQCVALRADRACRRACRNDPHGLRRGLPSVALRAEESLSAFNREMAKFALQV